MLIADKIRRNDQLAQEREAAEVQKSLRRMQEIKKERIKRLKTVLQSFFEKVKSDITAQADEGFELWQIGVIFDLSDYQVDTQEVADELELHTIEHPNKMGNFFTKEIDRSDYLEEFMDIYEWSHDQGIEVYWSFEEDRNAPEDEYSRPRGTYIIKVGYFD